MKVGVEFDELQELRNMVLAKDAEIKSLKNELGAQQPNELAKKMADEYFANFFESFGIKYPEGATQFWKSPTNANWEGNCSMNIVFSKKPGTELQFEASVKIIE